MKNIDYIVEVYDNSVFAYQLDVYDTYEEAYDVAVEHKKTLVKGEEVHITIVEYNENDNEIDISSERL